MRNLILLLALSAANVQAGLSRLDALGMIETGNDDAAVGEAGEVSRYQIKPWIWRRYCRAETYRSCPLSTQVAQRYLSDLEQFFRARTGREASDFDVYVLWNAGPTYYARIAFAPQRVHPVIRERATRYVNLRQLDNKPPKARVPCAQPTTLASSLPTSTLAEPRGQSQETLWPVVRPNQSSSLQNPLFDTLPLLCRPETSAPAPEPLLAVGGPKP
jgi:hypothetical protein